jgi:hypothetical protein
VYYIHSILHRALRDAVRWGYVVRNVADAADPPKAKTPEMRVWSPAQLRWRSQGVSATPPRVPVRVS